MQEVSSRALRRNFISKGWWKIYWKDTVSILNDKYLFNNILICKKLKFLWQFLRLPWNHFCKCNKFKIFFKNTSRITNVMFPNIICICSGFSNWKVSFQCSNGDNWKYCLSIVSILTEFVYEPLKCEISNGRAWLFVNER